MLAKTLKIGHFCTWNEKWLIPRGFWASKIITTKTSIAWPFGILVALYLDLNLGKNEKNLFRRFLVEGNCFSKT